MLAAVVSVATLIGTTAGLFGAWLMRNSPNLKNRAFVGVFSAGILVGLSLLSMLPDAVDTLRTEYEWRTSRVMLIFLISAACMFLLENVVFTHEHATFPLATMAGGLASQDGAASSSSAVEDAKPNAAASAAAVASADAMANDVPFDLEMMACPPCDETEDDDVESGSPRGGAPAFCKPVPTVSGHSGAAGAAEASFRHVGPTVNAAGAPAEGVGRRSSPPWRAKAKRMTQIPPADDPVAWWAAASVECECCVEGEGGVTGKHLDGAARAPNDARAPSDGYDEADADDAVMVPSGRCGAVRHVLGQGLRQAAWVLHAAVDGMVVGSVPRATLLAPAAFAVWVCALQDALAYAVFLTRRRARPRFVLVALVVFALAFPAGAAVACVLQSSLHAGGRQGLAIVRVAMAAIFCYMATELAPAHTHSKCTNLLYAATFGLGVAAAGAAELFESLATDGDDSAILALDAPGASTT